MNSLVYRIHLQDMLIKEFQDRFEYKTGIRPEVIVPDHEMFPLVLMDTLFEHLNSFIPEELRERYPTIATKGRKKEIVYLRLIFIYLVKNRSEKVTLKQIGAKLGHKDHSTVIWHLNRFHNELYTNPEFAELFETVMTELKNRIQNGTTPFQSTTEEGADTESVLRSLVYEPEDTLQSAA